MVSQVFEKLVNSRLADHLQKWGIFLISSVSLGLLGQRSTADLLTVASDRIFRVFNWSGATRQEYLIYPRLSTVFHIQVFFTNLRLLEFQVRYFPLFCFISVIDGFEWFWVGSIHKNIQLMLELLKAPFLVLHFSYYTLMTFLMMLSII